MRRMTPRPVLYTFRRCPYAMRARWALHVAGVDVEMREIVLRDKPAAMLAASPKGTVPVLVLPGGEVIDESLPVMRWALAQSDPQAWLAPTRGTLADMLALIDACEADFKPQLDRFKYPTRYRAEWGGASDAGDADPAAQAFATRHFDAAQGFLNRLSALLVEGGGAAPAYLCGTRPALADFAIVPFVRQFARHDAAHFARHASPALTRWVDALLARPDFAAVMARRVIWAPDGAR